MYMTARPSLLRYKDVEAIGNIYEETTVIINSVKEQVSFLCASFFTVT